MEKKRSTGVTILAIFHFLCVIPAFIFALFLGGFSNNPYGHGPTAGLPVRIFLMVNPLYFLISGIGILALKKWARVLAAIMSPIESVMLLLMIINVVVLAKGGVFIIVQIIELYLPPAILFGSICYYLTRPKVKEQFK